MKDMHPDLEWLARNVSEWPKGAENIRLDKDGEVCFSGAKIDDEFDFYVDDTALIKEIFRKSNDGGWTGRLYGKSRWLQARKDLGLIMSDEEEEIAAPEWDGYVDADDDTIPTSIKQLRYQDAKGEDWIDEFARTSSVDEFRGAMKFTIGKYNRRAGKKDELIKEIEKMRDYCDRWINYERSL